MLQYVTPDTFVLYGHFSALVVHEVPQIDRTLSIIIEYGLNCVYYRQVETKKVIFCHSFSMQQHNTESVHLVNFVNQIYRNPSKGEKISV